MKVSGDFIVPGSREQVFPRLVDPHFVGPHMPDMESMEVEGEE